MMKLQVELMRIKLKYFLRRLISVIPVFEYVVRLTILYVYIYRTVAKDESRSNKFSGLNILIVNHHFDQDIGAIADANKVHRIKVVDHRKLFGLANCFFAPAERDGRVPYDKLRIKARLNYRKQAKRIITLVRRYFPFDVMVTPSDLFFWIREVIYELKEMNIPTIVVDKEGTISPHSLRVHSLKVKERFPFISDKILVWSERQKEFWIRCGVGEKSIEVVGQPRSDFFFKKDKWKTKKDLGLSNERRVVLLFTYDSGAYIPLELFRGGFNWTEMRTETHQVIKKLAEEYPQIDFVVKIHPQQRDVSSILNDFSNAGHNIKLIRGSSVSNQLLVNSDIIVGFQTTALLEAMFLQVPILYTFWGKCVNEFAEELIPFHKTGDVEIVRSADELRKKIKYYIDTQAPVIAPYARENADKFIKDYFYMPNGHAGERTLRAVEEFFVTSNE